MVSALFHLSTLFKGISYLQHICKNVTLIQGNFSRSWMCLAIKENIQISWELTHSFVRVNWFLQCLLGNYVFRENKNYNFNQWQRRCEIWQKPLPQNSLRRINPVLQFSDLTSICNFFSQSNHISKPWNWDTFLMQTHQCPSRCGETKNKKDLSVVFH